MNFPNNNNGGPRPLSKKKTVQFLILLTILAWATQTLFHQWGYGSAVEPQRIDGLTNVYATAGMAAFEEKFVPSNAGASSGATLEVRSEATIVGAEVKVKQVCRWSDGDAALFAPIADLTLMRFGPRVPFRGIAMAEIKSTLRDAGVNIAAINFVGAASCTVARSDVEYSEADAMQKWIDAKDGKTSDASAEETGAKNVNALADDAKTSGLKPAAEVGVPTTQPGATISAEKPAFRTLRDLLTEDVATRTGVPIELIQMSFRQQDERLLMLAEPHFKFQIDPSRARAGLGDLSWNVIVFATDNSRQRATVSATARAWQTQLVVAKPVNFKQVLTDADLIERRTLIDRSTDDVMLAKAQAVGQQAGRDLKPGVVVTSRMVEAVPLVKAGQFVTVVYRQGGVELKSVGRALDGGSFGQTIRVKNETTRDIFSVTLTGPQTGSMTPATQPGLVSSN